MMKNTVTGFSLAALSDGSFPGWAGSQGLCRPGPLLHCPAGSQPSPGKPCQHTGYPVRKAAGRQMVRLSDAALFHTAAGPDYHDGRRFYICPILTKEPAVFTNGFHSAEGHPVPVPVHMHHSSSQLWFYTSKLRENQSS